MDIEWGPWIEHDGASFPLARVYKDGWRFVRLRQDGPDMVPDPVPANWGGFFWQWKGGLFRARRRVCLRAGFVPVIAYKLGRPKQPRAMERLRQLADAPGDHLVAPPPAERARPVPVREVAR